MSSSYINGSKVHFNMDLRDGIDFGVVFVYAQPGPELCGTAIYFVF